MIKNATVYSITLPDSPLQSHQFTEFLPCGASQERAVGWVPPRGQEHGPLIETVGGEMLIKLLIETKKVPGQALREAVDVKVKELEQSTGRKPGRKEKRDIQEDAALALLPKAFPKRVGVMGWIDRKNGLLILDTLSQSKADEFISQLLNAVQGVSVNLVHTTVAAQSAMTQWLLAESEQDWPGEFSVERECTLKANDPETASTVRFTNHNLRNNEVKKHVLEGKLPTQLGMSWDGRMGFVLTESLKLKKIQYLDGVMDASGQDEHEDRFDADVALVTGVMRPVLADLIAAMGGRAMARESGAVATQ
jgi:recombination associated protein RdgC